MSRYSKQFTASSANHERVLKTFHSGASSFSRIQTTLDSGVVKQFAAAYKGQVHLLTRPIVINDNIVIASLGDRADNATPVSFNPVMMTTHFVSLTTKSAASKFGLPTVAEDPLVTEAPGPSADDTVQPGADRIHFPFEKPDEVPVFAWFPVTCPIPVGATIPEGGNLEALTELEAIDFPFVSTWAKAVHYVMTHNEGFCLLQREKIFKRVDISPLEVPHQNFPTIEKSPEYPPFEMIMPSDKHYNVVLKALESDTPAKEKQTTLGKEPDNRPESTRDIIVSVIKALKSEDTTNKVVTTQTEKEQEKEAVDSLAKYKLFFASREDIVDPDSGEVVGQTVVYPAIKEVFQEIVSTTKTTRQQALMEEQMAAHLAQLKESESYLDQSVTLTPEMFDSVLVSSVANGRWITKPLAHDPGSTKDRITPFHLATPRTKSMQYKVRLEAGRLLQRQEQVNEDTAKIERKNTELYRFGLMNNGADVRAVVANIWALGNFITEDFAKSDFWKMLKHYDKILRSTAAQNWLGQHHKVPHLAHCLILDLCTITHLFAEIANRLEYRLAAKANNPISDKVFDTPCACAIAIATKLNNVLPTMQLGDYSTAPFTFSMFSPQQKKEDDSDSKPRAPRNGRNDSNTKSDSHGRNSDSHGRNGRDDASKKQKTGGLLVFSGSGKLPTWNKILEPHHKTGRLTRLCSNFLMQGRTCKWGDECGFVHLTRTTDLALENQKLFKTEIGQNSQLTWAHGNTSNGTTTATI
jgi:hypothetical protein